jgi:hypothetical protein
LSVFGTLGKQVENFPLFASNIMVIEEGFLSKVSDLADTCAIFELYFYHEVVRVYAHIEKEKYTYTGTNNWSSFRGE